MVTTELTKRICYLFVCIVPIKEKYEKHTATLYHHYTVRFVPTYLITYFHTGAFRPKMAQAENPR